jgi:SAM-dependent methyltransferase
MADDAFACEGGRVECEAILRRCEAHEISPPVALMQLLIAAEDDALVSRIVRASAATSSRVKAVADLLDAHAEGCARITTMLTSGMDSSAPHASVTDGIAFARRLFDWSVQQSEEASVALYSLGDPALLEAATREIVGLFDAWDLLGERRAALDIGCGIGRMEVALASRLGSVHGIDVSKEMIAAARRRCAALTNVTLSVGSGLDLAGVGDASIDFVFAVDSFPYLVQSGMALVDKHFAEAQRVLVPGGDFVVCNFSYRDVARDRDDVRALAESHGLEVRVLGESPFALWDGVAFRLVKGA